MPPHRRGRATATVARRPAIAPFDQVPPTQWDPWDLVTLLGIAHLQPRRVQERAARTPRGQRVISPQPRPGELALDVKFPLLNRHPTEHQLWVVVHYFALGYSADQRLAKVDPFMIADATGIGKTTEMAMLVAYLVWLHVECGVNPSFATPLMSPHKPYLLRGDWKEKGRGVSGGRVPATREIPLESILVVTKGGIKRQIFHELCDILSPERFDVFDFDASLHKRDDDARAAAYEGLKTSLDAGKVPIILMTWSGLLVEYQHVFSEPGKQKQVDPEFGGLSVFDIYLMVACYDEVGDVRNPATVRWKLTHRLTGQAQLVIGLTATPVHNSPLDLLNIFRAMGREVPVRDHDLYEKYRRYESQRRHLGRRIKKLRVEMELVGGPRTNLGKHWERTELPIGLTTQRIKNAWAAYEEGVICDIMEPSYNLVRPNIIRRKHGTLTKDGRPIVELSAYSEHTELVHLPPMEREAYDAIAVDRQLPRGFSCDIRQTLILPEYEAEVRDLYDLILPTKLRGVVKVVQAVQAEDEPLEPADRRKILIYMHWVANLWRVLNHFRGVGLEPAVINGTTPEPERAQIYADFQDEDEPRVLLISDASTEGVNLHRASVLIFIDYPWTGAAREQIIGRLARIGQTRPVQVVDVLVDDSIDCWLRQLEDRKSRFAAGVDRNAHLLAPLLSAWEDEEEAMDEGALVLRDRYSRERSAGGCGEMWLARERFRPEQPSLS